METVPSIAQSLAQYGPWGFCALLSVAVVKLFLLHDGLQKEVREIIQKNLADTLSVVESAKKVMEQTTDAVGDLKDIVRDLSSRNGK